MYAHEYSCSCTNQYTHITVMCHMQYPTSRFVLVVMHLSRIASITTRSVYM